MKESEINAIKARFEAATPGPWDSEESAYVYARVPGGRPNGEGIVHCNCYAKRGATDDKANAEFIAHAREDVPRLVQECDQLGDENKRLAKAICPDCDEKKEVDVLVSLAEDGCHALDVNPELVDENERLSKTIRKDGEDISRLVAEVERLRNALIVNGESVRMFFDDGLDEGIIIHRHRLREHAKRICDRIREALTP